MSRGKALKRLDNQEIEDILDELGYSSKAIRNKISECLSKLRYNINEEDIAYFIAGAQKSKLPLNKITAVEYGDNKHDTQAEDEGHDGSYIITINGKPTLYFWDYATNKPSKLFKPKTVTSSTESKVFSYKGQIITASSKQEAIQKVIAKTKLHSIQELVNLMRPFMTIKHNSFGVRGKFKEIPGIISVYRTIGASGEWEDTYNIRITTKEKFGFDRIYNDFNTKKPVKFNDIVPTIKKFLSIIKKYGHETMSLKFMGSEIGGLSDKLDRINIKCSTERISP